MASFTADQLFSAFGSSGNKQEAIRLLSACRLTTNESNSSGYTLYFSSGETKIYLLQIVGFQSLSFTQLSMIHWITFLLIETFSHSKRTCKQWNNS